LYNPYNPRMPLSVEDILHIPGLPLRLVAGKRGIHRTIRWAHVSELEDPSAWLKGGELLLTTGMGIGKTPARQRAYVKKLAGARLSGAVDPLLQKRFYPGPLTNLRRSYAAFHAFDKTHTIALAEAGLIPLDAASAILRGLRAMEAEGIEAARDRMGGGRHSGEAYLTEKLGGNVAG
jgi:hypothetical protein